MIATMHGDSLEELRRKPVSGQMVEKRRFERYVILRGRGEVEAILDGDGREVGRGT